MTLVSVAKSPQRFRDQAITFANGAEGRNIDIPSASPLNYYQVISAPGDMPKSRGPMPMHMLAGPARALLASPPSWRTAPPQCSYSL